MNPFSHLRLWFRARRYATRNDPGEIAWLLRTVKPGQTVLDVGGHKGAYTFWLRRAVGGHGQVVTFEPQPVLAKRLKALAKSWRNVRVEWLALSSKEGELELHVPKGGPSPGATLETRGTEGFDTVKVPVTTLDLYDAAQDLGRVSLIKVDVEGHELEFFKGGETVLRRDKPILIFECEARHRPDGVKPVFEWLQSLGYRGHFFLGTDLRPLSEFDPVKHQTRGQDPYCNNFVFQVPG